MRLLLSAPLALLAWLAVSAAAIAQLRSDIVLSAAIALAGGSVIGLSRVYAAGREARETVPAPAAMTGTQNPFKALGGWLDRNEPLLLLAASPFFLFPLRPFAPVVVLVPLLWVGRWIARGYITRRSPLNLLLFCLLVMLIPSTIAAADPQLALAKLVGLVFGAGLYAAVLNAPARDTAARTAGGLVWTALAVAAT